MGKDEGPYRYFGYFRRANMISNYFTIKLGELGNWGIRGILGYFCKANSA
jgi:hypothetical protein